MQNHLTQILALVTMEQPLSLSASHILQEKIKVLSSVRPLSRGDLVVGQYAGYLDEESIVNKQSRTETFAVAVLHINNPRWAGVPFVLKAGKALNENRAEVRIRFKAVPGAIPELASCPNNELIIRVQPNEGIYWKIQNKVPGLHFQVAPMRMDLTYQVRALTTAQGACDAPISPLLLRVAGKEMPAQRVCQQLHCVSSLPRTPPSSPPLLHASCGPCSFKITTTNYEQSKYAKEELPEAYERLILHVLHADKSHFVHAEELKLSWHIFSAVLQQMEQDPDDRPVPYMRGTRGPAVADELAQRYGMRKFGSQRFESNTAPPSISAPDRWVHRKGSLGAAALAGSGGMPAVRRTERRSGETAPRNEWPVSLGGAPSSIRSGAALAVSPVTPRTSGMPRTTSSSSVDEPPGFSTQFEEMRR